MMVPVPLFLEFKTLRIEQIKNIIIQVREFVDPIVKVLPHAYDGAKIRFEISAPAAHLANSAIMSTLTRLA